MKCGCVCVSAYLCVCVQPVSLVPRCPSALWWSQEHGNRPSSQGQTLNYHTVPPMAGDLQIISIDHGGNHTECRADSKIIST